MNITESPLGSLPANFTEAESDTSMIIRCGRWQVTTSTACGGVGGSKTRRNVVPTLLTVSTVPMLPTLWRFSRMSTATTRRK